VDGVPDIDLVDSTWIDVRPAAVAPHLADPANWPRWWPDLDLSDPEPRGDKGVRWTVRSAAGARLAGSMEVYLEPAGAGVVAHYILRLDAVAARPLSRGRAARLSRRYRRRSKQLFWGLADQLDPGRLARIAAPAPDRVT
jgi:hypothetical protein